MLKYKIINKDTQGKLTIATSLDGKLLLNTPQLNKGTAFTSTEREQFSLLGKLPHHIENLDDQVIRSYVQYQRQESNLEKNVYLNNLHDKNQVLFYALVDQHLEEMLPIVYTPTVGEAVKYFSKQFRRPRGLYIAYPDLDKLEQIFQNRSNPDIQLIVASDGEGVLGIGDQGVGAMQIPVAKLMVYTLCGGINPLNTLPVFLDVGTNNQLLLDDPMYLGWRHERVQGKAYDEFIGEFVHTVKKYKPSVFLHWEDFGLDNARRTLVHYQKSIASFNDDIQGTGVVTVAALLAALKATERKLTEQQIVIFGAGTAGVGIADQICDAMEQLGLPTDSARKHFYLIDKDGLLTDKMDHISPERKRFSQPYSEVCHWKNTQGKIELIDVIKNTKPAILIGTSAVSGAFSENIIKTMASYTAHPIIFPLSNPTERAEATPKRILTWTGGRALVATGSPFQAVTINQQERKIAQCNNAFAFPGLGLGVIASGAQVVNDQMLWAACQALSECSPVHNDLHAPLLPNILEAKQAAKQIALAVGKAAINTQVATIKTINELESNIEKLSWKVHYPNLTLHTQT